MLQRTNRDNNMRTLRTEPRKTCLARVEIYQEASDGQVRCQPGLMENISTSGMGLRVRTPFLVGSLVKIKTRQQLYLATVRHCARVDVEYFMGVQFCSVSGEVAAQGGNLKLPS